ncbi:hypothetical protein BH10PSE2_BH10PSE2_09220 [soil metagenome]
MVDSVGTTSGFSILSGALGLFLGGMLSIPWVILMFILVWIWGSFLERHPLWFSTVGFTVVVGAQIQASFRTEVAVACGAASAFYVSLWFWQRRPRSMRATDFTP